MPLSFRELLCALVLASAIVIVAPALAEEEAPPLGYSDAEVDAFAAAALDVQQVQNELQAKLLAADDPTSNEALQAEAQMTARQVVRDRGLSVQDYTEILTAANQDPGLNARIVAVLETKSR